METALTYAGCVVVLAVVLGVAAVGYDAATRRVVHRHVGPDSWAAACVDPRRPRAWRVLVIDAAGLRLLGVRGGEVRCFPWADVRGAVAADLRTAGAVVSHRGLQVELTDGSTTGFLFPSRTTLRYPAELVDRARYEVARHRPTGS